MELNTQARILKLQTLHPGTDSHHHDTAFLSSFSVMCPITALPPMGVFHME